jgi:hypothetical protein
MCVCVRVHSSNPTKPVLSMFLLWQLTFEFCTLGELASYMVHLCEHFFCVI